MNWNFGWIVRFEFGFLLNSTWIWIWTEFNWDFWIALDFLDWIVQFEFGLNST